MKTDEERLADKILPILSEKCKQNKCKHPKCKCGHCSRGYHICRNGKCTQINFDLTTCKCKEFSPT